MHFRSIGHHPIRANFQSPKTLKSPISNYTLREEYDKEHYTAAVLCLEIFIGHTALHTASHSSLELNVELHLTPIFLGEYEWLN